MNLPVVATRPPKLAKPLKLRKPAAIYRLISRKVKGKMKSPYWQVRIRLARGKYVQRTTGTTMRSAAKEFALIWIKQDFPHLCPALGIKPLERPTLESTPPPVVSQRNALCGPRNEPPETLNLEI